MSMPDVAEQHRLNIPFKNGSHHVSQETLTAATLKLTFTRRFLSVFQATVALNKSRGVNTADEKKSS